jgi:glyoxylase-like metal-dependent hydrolase (beta-lactamase superfamily II)
MPADAPIQLSERVFYLPGSVNTALVVGDGREAVLVDSGQDKDAGRRLKRACEHLGVTPVAILNTHAHADHYGGNDFLVRNTGVPVYAPPFEASILQNPYLEPVYLFHGAKPPKELLCKWLMAKPSPVDVVLQPGPLELAGVRLEILDTSGHAHTHHAVKVEDVLIAADAVFGTAVLERYPLPFGQDIERQRRSAERVAKVGARVALPGHGDPTEEVASLVGANLEAFERAAEAVAAACTGVSTSAVLQATCRSLGIVIGDLPRYHLNLCVVSAYLSYLRDAGRVELSLVDNELRWASV